MVREAALVAQRCMEAQENGIVNLSKCGLMAVPDALFLFLKNTEVSKVDLSFNQLKKVPSKLPNAFAQLKELNLSNNNELSNLPDEFSGCENLSILNLSGNKFTQLPLFAKSMQSLQTLDVSNNLLETLSEDEISFLASLSSVDLSNNKLTDDVKSKLLTYSNIVV